MQVALIGATGNVGQRVLEELIRRGHSVTAIMRHADTLPLTAAATGVAADVSDTASLIAALAGCEAALVTVRYSQVDLDALIGAMTGSHIKRWLAVGGTGSLRGPSGRRLMDDESLPPETLAEARASAAVLDRLRDLRDIAWTCIAPSPDFKPGKRDGSYRAGKDDLLMRDGKPASLSYENFAVAMVDELELDLHIHQHFTVADP